MSELNSSEVAPPPTVLDCRGNRFAEQETPLVRNYDFRNPIILTPSQLAQLSDLQAQFARQVSTRLSLLLRLECGLGRVDFSESNLADFHRQIAPRSYNCSFRAEPLLGLGQLTLPSPLAMCMVDRMLGGPGQPQVEERELTEIEFALVDDLMLQVLNEWFGQWAYERELQPSIMGAQRSGFNQRGSKPVPVVTLSIELTLGGATGAFLLCVPEVMLVPLIRSFQARQDQIQPRMTPVQVPVWHAAFEDVGVPITAHWKAMTLTLAELARLEVGTILPLPLRILDQTVVMVGSEAKFMGTVGIDGDRVAVAITSQIS